MFKVGVLRNCEKNIFFPSHSFFLTFHSRLFNHLHACLGASPLTRIQRHQSVYERLGILRIEIIFANPSILGIQKRL